MVIIHDTRRPCSPLTSVPVARYINIMILIIGAHNVTPDLWSVLHNARLMYTTYVQHAHNQHKTAFAIKNSSTLILPRWTKILEELELNDRMMPRDVSTRWNSTFDMLKFAIEYRLAIDTITAERDMKLRNYELGKEEWKVAEELCDVLKVCF